MFEAGVGLARRRRVDEGEANTGDDLDHEAYQRAAAEDIKPTGRGCGHGMSRRRSEQLAQMQPAVNPQSDPSQHDKHYVGSASVGKWPPSIHKRPFSTLYLYSYNPRGGGPAACEPSS